MRTLSRGWLGLSDAPMQDPDAEPPWTKDDDNEAEYYQHLDAVAAEKLAEDLAGIGHPHNLVLRQVCTDCGAVVDLPDFVKAER